MGERAYYIDMDEGRAYYHHWAAGEIWNAAKNGDIGRIGEIARIIKEEATGEYDRIEIKNIDDAVRIMQDWEIEAGIVKARGKFYVWLSTAPFTNEHDRPEGIITQVEESALQLAHHAVDTVMRYISVVKHDVNAKLTDKDWDRIRSYLAQRTRGVKEMWPLFDARIALGYMLGRIYVFGW